MKIIQVVVDEIPTNCSDCVLMKFIDGCYKCCGIYNDDYLDFNNIADSPYCMSYRRSDCPLVKETPNNADN